MNSSKAIMIAAVFMVAAFAGAFIAADSDADSYSITYKVGDKTFIVPNEDPSSATVKLKTLAEIGAAGEDDKTFTAWEDDAGNTYVAGSTYIIDTTGGKVTATLTAQFDWTVYTAIFKDADGKVLDTITGTMEDGTGKDLSALAPEAPELDGLIFAGWLADGAEKATAVEDLGKLKADATYTATYTVDYIVTFIDGDKTYISSVSDLTVPDLGERTGFTFLGWFIGTEQEDPELYDYNADTTFTAKWEPVNVYVTFEAGSFSTKVAVLYGETVVEPALPSGYTGWGIKNADGTITAFDFSKAITEDMTVVGIAAAPAKATGLSDPITMTIAIIIGTLVLVGIAGVIVLQRKGKIVIGRGPNAKKSSEEEKKE